MKRVTTFFIFILTISALFAQTNEDNIIIENKTENYTFTIFSKQVFLKEKNTTNYLCLKWSDKITVAELYSLNSTIDMVDIKAEKKINPVYETYRDKDIFYSDRKICYFELPFSQKGVKTTVSFEKTYKDICLANRIIFSEIYFVKEKKVEITIPDWLELEIIEQNFNDSIKKEIITNAQTKAVTYKYTIRNQEGLQTTDNSPAYHKIAPHILLIPKNVTINKEKITYFENYDDVYKWCKDKVDQTQNDTEVISQFTQQLIDSCKTDDEKIASIFSWVQNNIRYIAFEYGLDSWIPDNAQNVLRKKYGDCKGMSNLLKTMLHSAGFDAHVVWIGTDGLSKNSNTLLPLFNHMICALKKDNQIVYLDPTIKYMVPGEYHNAIQDCYTMIENGDSYILDSVPKLSPSQNTDSLICVYHMEGNSLLGNVAMTLSGECKQSILSIIYMLESSRRNSVLAQFLKKGKSNIKVSDILIEGEDSRHNQLTLNYNEIRNNCINRIGDEIYVNFGNRQDFISAIIDTTKRKTDFVFPFKERTIREEYLRIPEGFKVISVPAALNIENNNYKIKTIYSVEDDRIRCKREIIIKEVWLKKEHFAQWNADLNLLKRNYSEQIILQNE